MLNPDKLKKDEQLLSQFIVKFFRNTGEFLASRLEKTPLTPNMLSLIGIFLACAASFLLAGGTYLRQLSGALTAYIVLQLDFIDGALARRKNMATKFGDWLDAMGDEIREFLIIFGTAFGVYKATGNYLAWAAAFIMLGSDALIMRSASRYYKTEDKRSHFDELGGAIKGNAFLSIAKEFISVRVIKFAALPIFAIFGSLLLYLEFFAVYELAIALAIFFYFSFKVWHNQKRS